MNLNIILIIGCVLTFVALAACAESLDVKAFSEADVEALLSKIARNVGKDDSMVVKFTKESMAGLDELFMENEKETGLSVPKKRKTKLALIAGKMAQSLVNKNTPKTDADVNELFLILEQSYNAEKGTIGAPYSALTYATLCFVMKRSGEALIWLEKATEGLKEGRLFNEIESAKADVLREGRDSLKFTGSIAGSFSGMKGWQYEFKLSTPSTGGVIFEGYQVVVGEASYSITNVRHGTYLLRIYERRDGDLEPSSFVCAKNVTVEEGKVTTFDVVLASRINLLAPDHGKKIIFKDCGVLAFKWEMPAVAKKGVIYDIRIQVPASSTPYPKGLKGIGLGRRKINGLGVEIPVSEFREKGEYSWSVEMLDENDNRNPAKPLARSGVRTFVVE